MSALTHHCGPSARCVEFSDQKKAEGLAFWKGVHAQRRQLGLIMAMGGAIAQGTSADRGTLVTLSSLSFFH